MHHVGRTLLLVVTLLASTALAVAEPVSTALTDFEIPAASLADALSRFGAQTGMQVVYSPDLARGLKSRALSGRLTPNAALEQLLEGTGLTWTYVNADTLVLKRVDDASVAKKNSDEPRPATGLEEITVYGIPEVLVTGTKILNMDIRRTADDPQPYVVFESDALRNSAARNLEEFFKQRLPMNSIGETENQFSSTRPNRSQINLRGLGANQTLILVDGQRLADDLFVEGPNQGDINSIPLRAIERVEILPTTASGIYGGRATGGVINIVLRRDYEGLEGEAGLESSFESWTPTYRANLTGGLTFGEGKTSVLMSLHYADIDHLRVRERDIVQRYRARQVRNNPSLLAPPNLPDGATTNISSADASPLFGPGTPSFTSAPQGYAGGGGIAPLQANAGTYNTALSQTTSKLTLWNEATVKSGVITLRHEFSPRIQIFVEAAASQNEGSAPFSAEAGVVTVAADAPSNPFGQDVLVSLSDGIDSVLALDNRSRRLRVGSIVRIGAGWNAELNYVWSDARNNTTAQTSIDTFALEQAIAAGDVDVFRDTRLDPIDFTPYALAPASASEFSTKSRNTSLLVGGPLGDLPAGAATLTTKVEYRDEQFDPASVIFDPSFGAFFSRRSQTIKTVYSEARVPILSGLELQLAGRYDQYHTVTSPTTFGSSQAQSAADTRSDQSSFNPTIALRYQVLPDLALRASYGTGFLPPSIANLAPFPPEQLDGILTDPRRGNEPLGTWDYISGGNPDLEPEDSRSWSAGVILTPRFAPNLRFSVDYTRIEKTDNIFDPSDLPFIDLAAYEAAFPDRVIRAPASPGDPFGIGPITAIDVTAVNISQADVEAYDFSIDYRLDAGERGVFDAFLLATRQTRFETRLLPAEPTVENVGIGSGNPLAFKANAGLTWRLGAWTLGWIGRYFDSYTVSLDPNIIASQGSTKVDSQQYHDVFATYRFGSSVAADQGVDVTLGVSNLFNEEPPFDAANKVRLYSPFGDPRLASYSLSVRTRF